MNLKKFLNRSFFEPFEIYDVAARKKKVKKFFKGISFCYLWLL